MSNTPTDIKKINKILNDTISTIETNREEIFDIVIHARNECQNTEEQLLKIKEEVGKAIEEVDRLEIEEKKSKAKLVVVSKDFDKYYEKDIRNAYEDANEIRVRLSLKRQEEKRLIEKRNELEVRLKEAIMVLEKAESINKQVGVAMEYLKGNLDDILTTVDDLSKKKFLGIKIIEAQEEERHRLARDMHDGLAQSMANIVVKTEICEKLLEVDEHKAKIALKELKEIARFNLKDIREIIYDLRPMTLDDLGLVPTLEKYFIKFQHETGVIVELETLGNIGDLEPAFEIVIFRIIQEALNNVQKHANANTVTIVLEGTKKRLNLMVFDDGIGFDVNLVSEKRDFSSSGYGLISMKERAELINGKLEIKSSPGMGTKIYLSIPLVEEEIDNE